MNTFNFFQPTALVRFVDRLPTLQQRAIGRVELNLHHFGSFGRDSRDACCEECFGSSRARLSLEKLPNLRTLDIRLDTSADNYQPQRAKAAKCRAQGIYEFLRDVKVSKVLTIELRPHRLFDRVLIKREERREWPAHCQEAFACAVWTLLGDPTSSIPRGVDIQDRNQAKCVLVAKFTE